MQPDAGPRAETDKAAKFCYFGFLSDNFTTFVGANRPALSYPLRQRDLL